MNIQQEQFDAFQGGLIKQKEIGNISNQYLQISPIDQEEDYPEEEKIDKNEFIPQEKPLTEHELQIDYQHDYQQYGSKKPTNQVIIEVRNVQKTYLLGAEGVPALRGVNLKVYKGEFLCILGTSGGGKTTLLNVMGTIDKPTKGQVTICGHRIRQKTPDKLLASLRLEKIAFVFQTFNLLGSLNVLENVELPMTLRGKLSKSDIRKRATMLLEKVGLSGRMLQYPNQLSGGEQQRVTIARALSNEPTLLFLDEPTGDLDTKNTEMIMDFLLKLNKSQGTTLVMVTHEVNLKNFCHRVVRMLDGKVQRIETISEQNRNTAINQLLQNKQIQREEYQVSKQGQAGYQQIENVKQEKEQEGLTEKRTYKHYSALSYMYK